MKSRFVLLLAAFLVSSAAAGANFDPKEYTPATQADLMKNPEGFEGRKFRVTDPFQFCGSDFCVRNLLGKFNTRDYFCFALGEVCLVRMYIRKDHPETPWVLKLRKGDRVNVYGTFGQIGTDFKYMVVDHIEAAAAK